MQIKKAEIVISAVRSTQYPADQLPEIAVVGRSNVGKSSLLNALLQRKNLARISSKPGKTQTLNFYLINDQFRLVDVPGYGYAQVSKSRRAEWGKMIETYLTTRENLRAVISIIDFRHLPTKDDLQMIEYLKYYQLPIIMVATKVDKVAKSKRVKQEQLILQELSSEDNLANNDQFIVFSAETKQGVADLWQAVEGFI